MYIIKRKSLQKTERTFTWSMKIVPALDKLSPGWKRVKVHWIMGRSDSPDLLYELKGRVFLRGWDYTGAINGYEWIKKASKRKLLRNV
jgi:hypothetical protein